LPPKNVEQDTLPMNINRFPPKPPPKPSKPTIPKVNIETLK